MKNSRFLTSRINSYQWSWLLYHKTHIIIHIQHPYHYNLLGYTMFRVRLWWLVSLPLEVSWLVYITVLYGKGTSHIIIDIQELQPAVQSVRWSLPSIVWNLNTLSAWAKPWKMILIAGSKIAAKSMLGTEIGDGNMCDFFWMRISLCHHSCHQHKQIGAITLPTCTF